MGPLRPVGAPETSGGPWNQWGSLGPMGKILFSIYVKIWKNEKWTTKVYFLFLQIFAKIGNRLLWSIFHFFRFLQKWKTDCCGPFRTISVSRNWRNSLRCPFSSLRFSVLLIFSLTASIPWQQGTSRRVTRQMSASVVGVSEVPSANRAKLTKRVSKLNRHCHTMTTWCILSTHRSIMLW